MATTNPVFQVLVTSGNQAPLAAGSRVDALAIGQIGVFNYHTGLSLGAASIVGDTRDIFLAVGIDPLATGSLADINKSAGQVIQVRNAKSLTMKGYTIALPKIVDLTDLKANCESDYALKIEFRNQAIYSMQGYNGFTKTFAYRTGCCADSCSTCAEGDCNELALGLVQNINNDPDGLVTAQLIDYTTVGTGADAIVVAEGAEYTAWVANIANAGLCLGIRLTSVATAINNYNGINLGYFNPRGTDIIVSLVDGFSCNGTLTTYQELRYQQGLGYDIQQLEYVAGGWNGKPGPYRVSTSTNMQRDGITYFASRSGTYTQLSLTYDQMSVGGWLEYLNNLETIVAIPCADTTTLTGLVAILDVIFTQFAPSAGDAAILDCDNPATSTLTPATDGIESLA